MGRISKQETPLSPRALKRLNSTQFVHRGERLRLCLPGNNKSPQLKTGKKTTLACKNPMIVCILDEKQTISEGRTSMAFCGDHFLSQVKFLLPQTATLHFILYAKRHTENSHHGLYPCTAKGCLDKGVFILSGTDLM